MDGRQRRTAPYSAGSLNHQVLLAIRELELRVPLRGAVTSIGGGGGSSSSSAPPGVSDATSGGGGGGGDDGSRGGGAAVGSYLLSYLDEVGSAYVTRVCLCACVCSYHMFVSDLCWFRVWLLPFLFVAKGIHVFIIIICSQLFTVRVCVRVCVYMTPLTRRICWWVARTVAAEPSSSSASSKIKSKKKQTATLRRGGGFLTLFVLCRLRAGAYPVKNAFLLSRWC